MKLFLRINAAISMASILFFIVSSSTAQNTKILTINYGGAPASQTNLVIIQPKQQAATVPVQAGSTFPSGTVISTPSSTTVEIGANGNKQEILPNTQHSVRITPNMETHKTISGKVVHYVLNKPVGYTYRASGNNVYAKPPGTVFSVDVGKDKAKFETIEGQIITVEKVNVKIGEASKNNASSKNRPLTTTKTQTFNAGESTYFDDKIDSIYYATYEEALSKIQQQLSVDQNSSYVDFEQIADDNMAIGELYLDDGYPSEAIDYFNEALNNYYKLEFEEMSIAEAHLLIAESHYILGNDTDSQNNAKQAINIITPLLEYNLIDYKYAIEDEDYYLQEDIAYELYYNYDYMGWAYELLNDDVTADKYYGYADSLPVSGY